ncbi:MAG: QacE family quaternary ammonium compound efflux SMR transporter [Rhodospirillaceae bacterium]|nr:QacE family quaternary ammonium compound efflux SMR transporter [Rhodospirillaceae bacterium]
MTVYLYLVGSILLEVTGTLLLPVTNSFTRVLPTVAMASCYLGSLFLLTIVVKLIPLAVVYATWSGLGVFSVAILGYFIFGQTLPWPAIFGLFLIVLGVVLVNAYTAP